MSTHRASRTQTSIGTLCLLTAALCSLALVLASCGSGAETYTIGVVQMIAHPSPDAVRDGFVQALADAGYVEGENVEFQFEVAQGEFANTQLIAQSFVADKVDMVFAIGTPPLQGVLQVVPETLPVVFAFVSDPWGAGAGTSLTDHLPNTTGIPDLSPLEDQVALIKELLPRATRVGLIFNPGEANSSTEASGLRQAAQTGGLVVIEQPVAGSTEVLEAANALAIQDIDVFARIGDYATTTALSSIVQVSHDLCVPIVSTMPGDVEEGALAAVGWVFYMEGYDAGGLAVRIMEGENPADMPFQMPSQQVLKVNASVAEMCGIELPQAVLERANTVIR